MKKAILALTITLTISACESTAVLEDLLAGSSSGDSNSLSSNTIAQGLREALTVGSERVVDTLGTEDGFLKSAFHIPLPKQLQDAKQVASRFGLGGPFDELEVKMNRAAEAAAPKARSLFVGAIRQMNFQDVMSIYRGPDDAATQYLKRTTGEQLSEDMRPVIDSSLQEVGAVNTLNSLVSRYNALPLVKPIDADLSGHVLNYANDAVFKQLAVEEAAIRQDPVKRSTELLRQVFGAR